jgi:hypothetical protein
MFTSRILCASFLAAATLAAADQAVYTTKLENGWKDWSWAKVVKSGKKLSVNAKSWQGLYFHHDDQPSSNFKSVSFTVDPGPSNQQLFVHATIKGKPLKAQKILTAPANRVLKATVKFSDLGLTNEKFDGFWIQASNKPATFVVTDVVLHGR